MITITQSKQSSQATAALRIQSNLQISLENLIRDYNLNIGLVWNNLSLTPQEVCDALDGQASQLFIIGGATQQLIAAISPESLARLEKPKKKFNLNQDGTVTILEEDY